MEGYFWRVAAPGTAVVAFTGVSRDAAGATWATVGLAAHPGRVVRTAVAPHATACTSRLRLEVGSLLRADPGGLEVDLGPGARLRVRFADVAAWPRRAVSGIGPAGALPWLAQYWHPHMLDGRAEGTAELGARHVDLTGARVYGEKNWTPYVHGFPSSWWWGQAFPDDDASVCFAGGRIHGLGAGALVLRLGRRLVHAVGPPAPLRMRVGEGTWWLQARTLREQVLVEGEAADAPYRLPVPVPRERRAAPDVSAMHLAGTVRVRVRRGRRLVFDGTSELAGLEHGGAHAEATSGYPMHRNME